MMAAYVLMPMTMIFAEGAGDTGSDRIVSTGLRTAQYRGKSYQGYDDFRTLYVVSRSPRPMGLLLKSRENYIWGMTLTVTGAVIAALMAPVVYDPDDYSMAPPLFVFPVGIGIAVSGGTLLLVSQRRWNRSITVYNQSHGNADAQDK
jgi:hypothetical protein